jgi:O-antigen/teichoic acid export membrane protein
MRLNLAQSLKSFVQLSSANVAVKLLGIVMIAFFTRYLRKDELAILPVYEMLAALAGIIFSFGLQPTFLRLLPARFAEDPNRARSLIFSGAILLLPGAAVYSIGVHALADWINPRLFGEFDYAGLIRITAVGYFFVALKNFAQSVLWSCSRFDRISLVQITAAFGRVVFLASGALLWGTKGLALGLVANEILTALMTVWFIRDIIAGPRVPLHPLGDLLRQSWPFYLEGFLIYFRSQGDNWIVASMLGPNAIAVYFVAKRLPLMMQMFVESLDKVLTSEISKRRKDPEELAIYVRRLFRVNTALALPGTMFVMGLTPAFILIVAGREYAAAVIPCLLLCATLPIQAVQLPFARGIFVLHPPLVRVGMTVLESVVLITCLLLLASPMAEIGIAASRLIAAMAGLGLAVAVMRRSLGAGLDWSHAALSTVASGAMLAVMLLVQRWNDSVFASPLVAAAGAATFLGATSLLHSKTFYEAVNQVSPFRIKDPLRYVAGRLAGRNRP